MSAPEPESEFARIDRAWEAERQRHLVTSRRGVPYVPSAAAAVAMGVFAVGFGLFWTATMVRLGGPVASTFVLFGLVFVVAGAGVSFHQLRKAIRYRAAYRAYRRRREAARGRMP